MAKQSDVTAKTLQDTPGRALDFLMGVSGSAGIFNLLRLRGYSMDEHQRGWLLLEASGALRFDEESLDGRTDASRALAELDNLDERVFRLVRASLENGFPDQATLVLEGLSATQGPMVVLHMGRLLERLQLLDASKKDQDKRAMAKLAERGLGKAERERLSMLVAQARALPAVAEQDPAREAERKASYEEALKRLRAWHLEWSEVARAVIERRDYLIRLGLAAPRRDRAGEDEGDAEGETPAGELQS